MKTAYSYDVQNEAKLYQKDCFSRILIFSFVGRWQNVPLCRRGNDLGGQYSVSFSGHSPICQIVTRDAYQYTTWPPRGFVSHISTKCCFLCMNNVIVQKIYNGGATKVYYFENATFSGAHISEYVCVTRINLTSIERWGFQLSNEMHSVSAAYVVSEILTEN